MFFNCDALSSKQLWPWESNINMNASIESNGRRVQKFLAIIVIVGVSALFLHTTSTYAWDWPWQKPSQEKTLSPEEKQFVSSLSVFSGALTQLSSRREAAMRLVSLGEGLQNGSPSVMNMKGSEFIQREASLRSAPEDLQLALDQTGVALAKLNNDYKVLKSKGKVLPQIEQFLEGWIVERLNPKSLVQDTPMFDALRSDTQALLAELSKPVISRPSPHEWAVRTCLKNQRELDGAKEQWALENKKTGSDTPTIGELVSSDGYIKRMPVCPEQGKYTLGSMMQRPACSIPDHTSPW